MLRVNYFPPNFQFSTAANTNEGLTQWCLHAARRFHKVRAQCWFDSVQDFPVTFGKNEKGGMNTKEFHEYIENTNMKFYPDACDKPGKRVLLKMDSGPGRDNLELIVKLCMMGFYLYPSIPNATHVIQEMDDWLGNLKTMFYRNLRLVTEAYVTNRKAMPNSEDTMGLLFFWCCIFYDDQDPTNVCENALQISASKENMIVVFAKMGVVPFTRECIHDKHVRHDICLVNGEAIYALDPLLTLVSHWP
jgi:hypothetical protein